MESNPTGAQPTGNPPVRKSIRDYISWIGFFVTVGVMLQQILSHGNILWHYDTTQSAIFNMFSDPQFTALDKVAAAVGLVNSGIFFLYPLVLLVFMALRKRIVPALLVIFAIAAMCFNVWGQVEAVLLLMQYAEPFRVFWQSLVFLGVDIVLLVFYRKSRQFKAIFTR